MRSREPWRLPAGQSRAVPFLQAAVLFAALCIFARSAALVLAAFLAAPVPAAQTLLHLGQQAVESRAAEPSAESVPEAASAPSPAQEAAAPVQTGVEQYFVALQPDEARPADAGAVTEQQFGQGSGEKYIPCGAGSIKNNTRQTAADLAAEIENPLPFAIEKDSPDPQVLVMHTHATEDYRLSAGLWFTPGDGARSTDRSINMCAVGRVMADTLNAAGIHTLHDDLDGVAFLEHVFDGVDALAVGEVADLGDVQQTVGARGQVHEGAEGGGLHDLAVVGLAGFRHVRVGDLVDDLLGLLGGLLQTLQGHRIFAQVDVMLFFELVGHPVDNHVVEVVASEVRVAVGRFHFEYAVAQFQNRNIERAASEVVYGDLHILVRLIQAVGQRCGRRFVDDTAHFQTGDFARFLGSLALRVGEVGRNGDDGFGYFGAEVILGGLFHFLQDDRGDFLRGIESAVDIDARGVVVAFDHFVSRPFNVFADLIVSLAHETLDRRDRTLRVGDRLPFGGVAHFPFVVVHERYDRRCRAASLAVGDHHGFVTLHHGNAGVRST